VSPIPYNNLVSRLDRDALIPEQVINSMLGKARDESAVMSLFRQVPVARDVVRLPVLSALPTAYFVDGDTGLKQTTEMAWSNKYLNVEEIATIMPIPENVIEDDSGDIWGDAEPYVREAFARTLDAAVIFGTNKPSSWPTAVSVAAAAAGNTVTSGTATNAQGSIFGDIDNLIGTIEDDGFDISGYVAARSFRRNLRTARNVQGDRVDAGRVSGDLNTLDGSRIAYPMRGMWPTTGSVGTRPLAVAGAFNEEFVYGVRKDVTMKILTESVIQDNTGAIIYNLAQQDMVAVRVKFRIGWQVANTLNNDNPTEGSRYPAAVLTY
jgi:HK97 family phage major capsid protein